VIQGQHCWLRGAVGPALPCSARRADGRARRSALRGAGFTDHITRLTAGRRRR
jgi:hypothetical protein